MRRGLLINVSKSFLLFGLLGPVAGSTDLLAQGTAFTYQGRLADGGGLATGSYDFVFSLTDSSNAGNYLGANNTNCAVGVTNGLFMVLLDFGAEFDGGGRWLEVSVRTNGASDFTTLTPRQQLTPTPYAILASNALTAATITGPVPNGSLSGNYTGSVTFNNASNVFGGVFSGNGAGMSNIQPAAISGGLNFIANTNGTVNGSINITNSTENDGAKMAMANGSWQLTTSGPAGTTTNMQASTNGSVTFPHGMTMDGGLTRSNSYILNNRAVSPLTNFPVASLSPVNATSPIALDLMPSPGASDYLLNGVAWIDLCNTNCLTSQPTNLQTLRLQVSHDGSASVGSMGFNGASGGYFSIIQNGNRQILFQGSGMFIYTTPQPSSDGGVSLGYNGGRWKNLYLLSTNYLMGSNSAVAFGTNSDAILSRVSGGTLQVSTNLNVKGTLSANILTVTNTASIRTNTAAFGTVSQPITLGSTFTNLAGGRADFVGQFTFNLSDSGNSILVISNLTTGLVITNSIPGVSGAAMQGVIFPDASPNDICEAYDASIGMGASVAFVQGWWIVK